MPGSSPMVSLRIPEDHLMELDRLVGFDGMRNRSDVVREAVRRMLASLRSAAEHESDLVQDGDQEPTGSGAL